MPCGKVLTMHKNGTIQRLKGRYESNGEATVILGWTPCVVNNFVNKGMPSSSGNKYGRPKKLKSRVKRFDLRETSNLILSFKKIMENIAYNVL